MSFLLVVVLCAFLVTLVAWVALKMAGRESPRTNPLFWFVGAVVMGAGLIPLIGGAEQILQVMGRPGQGGLATNEELADAASAVVWGFVILTNGAYIWRGARRRGWQDRLGRLLLIVGYVLLGVAMHEALHRGSELGSAGPGGGETVANDIQLVYLAWGLPAAVVILFGTWLARERLLMTVYLNTSS